jgi:KDO2-lipid IV(A) lauroyltransferase
VELLSFHWQIDVRPVYHRLWECHTLVSCFVYALARLVITLFRILPRSLGIAILKLLATCVYFLDARHRHIAEVNLKIAFPDLPASERRRIARRSFRNTAMNLLEVSKLPELTPENISELVRYDPANGLNNYRAALERGKGILYLTGHFSSWELLPTAHALHGYPLSFITRPLDNARLDQYLLKVRESKGNRVFGKKNSARYILSSLKSAGSAGILMDQNTSLQEGMFVDFFGIPAATTTGMALLALRTDAPVLPGYMTPARKGRYTIKFLPPIDMVRTGDRTRDLEINTRQFNKILEQIIRDQPDSWLWGHKRWKYQPDGNPQNLYALSNEALDSFLKNHQKPPA